MQNNVFKNLGIFWLLCLTCLPFTFAQDLKQQIQTADSLFYQKNYLQALRMYEQVFTQQQGLSPTILLRMAYIHEGLADYTQALYYLNLYYQYSPQPPVIEKMQEIAAKYNLAGYEFKDQDFFMVLYDQYYVYLALTLISVCMLFFASMLIRKLRKEPVPIRHGVGFGLLLVIVFLFLNLRKSQDKAIVATDNVYLMNAPSAGARLVQIVGKGHRLDVRKREDIWLEVSWKGETAYVRQQNVLLVQ